MIVKLNKKLIILLLLNSIFGCKTKSSGISNLKVVRLDNFKTLVAVEDQVLGVPNIIRFYSNNSHLFVYDKGLGRILELDNGGNIINTYGRRGRGPGEFLRVKNIFLIDDYLYVVDPLLKYFHKFDLSDGNVSSINYGGSGRSAVPPAPFTPSVPTAENLDNQPIVTSQGDLLLSPALSPEPAQTIYKLKDLEGNLIAEVGEVPEGSRPLPDFNLLEAEINNHEVPGFYRSNAFPVIDHANPEEIFLIYTAYPIIAKYSLNGKKLWKKNVPTTAMIDSVRTHFYETMDQMIQSPPKRDRIALEYYVAGVSSPQGDLFLIMNSKPLVIHQFNNNGKLIKIYKLISEEVDLLPIFTINFNKNYIFVVTKMGEIRMYPF